MTMGFPETLTLGDQGTARFEIVLVSDDAEHARDVIEDLGTSRFAFQVTQVFDRQFIGHALARLATEPPCRMPAIVLLDFAFLGDACETVAASIADMRASMAVECIVTRPPTFGSSALRLQELGVFFFDQEPDVATLERMVN